MWKIFGGNKNSSEDGNGVDLFSINNVLVVEQVERL